MAGLSYARADGACFIFSHQSRIAVRTHNSNNAATAAKGPDWLQGLFVHTPQQIPFFSPIERLLLNARARGASANEKDERNADDVTLQRRVRQTISGGGGPTTSLTKAAVDAVFCVF